MSRQLPTQPLPVAPVPIGSYGRNRRFGLWWFIHIEQLLKRLSRRTRSERALVTAESLSRRQVVGVVCGRFCGASFQFQSFMGISSPPIDPTAPPVFRCEVTRSLGELVLVSRKAPCAWNSGSCAKAVRNCRSASVWLSASGSGAKGRNGANCGAQSAAERRGAESQTEAADEFRFPCLRPGRAGAEWSASATAVRVTGPASGRKAEWSGRWSRRVNGSPSRAMDFCAFGTALCLVWFERDNDTGKRCVRPGGSTRSTNRPPGQGGGHPQLSG